MATFFLTEQLPPNLAGGRKASREYASWRGTKLLHYRYQVGSEKAFEFFWALRRAGYRFFMMNGRLADKRNRSQ